MERLTERKNEEIWKSKGLHWTKLHVGMPMTEELMQLLHRAMYKLMHYEDTGLTPDQIREFDKLYLAKCEEVNQLKAELAAERQKTRWIPVEEKLPDKYTEVLVAFEDGFNGVVAWYSETNKIWWNANTERHIEAKIIAWQPLPEPYQPEKGGAAGCTE